MTAFHKLLRGTIAVFCVVPFFDEGRVRCAEIVFSYNGFLTGTIGTISVETCTVAYKRRPTMSL